MRELKYSFNLKLTNSRESLIKKKKLFIIVLLGPDGAGKSSLIDSLTEHYGGLYLNYYSHLYPTFKGKTSTNIPNDKPHSKKSYKILLSIVKLLYMYIRFFYNIYQMFIDTY